MTRAARFVLVSAGLVAVAVMLSLTNAGPALAQTFKPVMSLIVNDATRPVPIVATEPLPVIDAGAAAQPFQQFVRSADNSVTVPEGKRLVIEFVSGTSSAPITCQVRAMRIRTSLSTDADDFLMNHSLIAVPTTTSPFNGYTISQPVKLYAGPGTTVIVSLLTTPQDDCAADFLGVVSGYFVDVE